VVAQAPIAPQGDAGQDGGGARSPWVPALVAIVAVALIAAVAVFVVRALDSGSDGDDDVEPAAASPLAELLAPANALVVALQDERTVAVYGVVGVDDALALTVRDGQEARRSTDAAVTDVRAAITRLEDAGVPVDVDVLDALSPLPALRSEIDGRDQASTLAEMPYAGEVVDRYGEMIDAVSESASTLVLATDDPELRRTAGAWVQGVAETGLMQELSIAVLADLTAETPESIAQISALGAQIEQGRSTVADLAAGSSYEPAADQLTADLEAAGLAGELDRLLERGQSDIATTFAAISESSVAWRRFNAGVADELASAAGAS
jgi:hypothetical protein